MEKKIKAARFILTQCSTHFGTEPETRPAAAGLKQSGSVCLHSLVGYPKMKRKAEKFRGEKFLSRHPENHMCKRVDESFSGRDSAQTPPNGGVKAGTPAVKPGGSI